MKKLKFIKAAFCSLILSAGVLPVTALDAYVTVIYRDVDIAFVNKSEKELNGVLSKNNEDRNYYLVENYTMKKIRHLIVDEDFNFASKATLVVIDNNLDNMEAVDLYATISAALQRQEEQKRLVEEKKKAEIAKFEAEKAKLTKELSDINKWIAGTAGKLKNERFVNSAPEQVVANARAQLADLEARKVRTEELLATLG